MQQRSGGAVILYRGFGLRSHRRIHGVSLPFIPGSNSLVYSVMVNLLSRGVGRKKDGRERVFEMLNHSYYSFARRVNVCDSIVTQFSNDAKRFSNAAFSSNGSLQMSCADPIVSLSQSLVCH